jgi:NitT/TauT family transport system ATP-binding protein
MPNITVQGIGKSFGFLQKGVRALNNVSFSVRAGEFVCLVGPSGCGKTTLLRIVGDLLSADQGTVRIGELSPAEARSKGVFSWVFQTPVLLPWRDVIRNVTLPTEIQSNRKARDLEALLQLVGLTGFENYKPAQLSGGMQQRSALARALIFYPQVLLMDEPFAALDEFTRANLNLELLRICQEVGVTVLFVTHSINEAVFLGDRVVVLSRRPGTVNAVVDVPIRGPRDNSIRSTAQFREIAQCIESNIS